MHQDERSAPLQSMWEVRIQDGSPLPLDQQLRWIPHFEAILAVPVLRVHALLPHSDMDVCWSLGQRYETHFNFPAVLS